MAAPPGAADLEGLWSSLVALVGQVSGFTRTYLQQAHPVTFAKNTLTIGFPPEAEDHIALVDNPRNQALLQTKLAELGHGHCQIKFVKSSPPPGRVAPGSAASAVAAPRVALPSGAGTGPARAAAPAAGPAKEKLAPVPFNQDQFKDDPLIQKALEIFKGQIVEVRA